MSKPVDFNKVIVLDIETVSQYKTFAEVPERMQQLWAHKTEAVREKENKTPQDFYERAGIWAEFGKIVCISVAIFTNEATGIRVKSFYGHQEKEILEAFISLLNKQSSDTILCAHNGKEFDYPYLCRRMLINGVSIPEVLQISGKKPWEINHLDTMDMWRFGDYKNYTSLDLLAATLGIPTPKDDITGAQVGQVYWEEQNLDRIATYCQKDVVTTCQVLLKLLGKPSIADAEIFFV